MALSPIVVKVGGSLFDLADLGARLRSWLKTLAAAEVLLVPGGGQAADVVRALDRIHRLGADKAHWLAIRALTLNAHGLAALLPSADVIVDLHACPDVWRQRRLPILDLFPFTWADEGRPGALPHSWDVTSDSLAARVAVVLGARQLLLLKSTALPSGADWAEAARLGLVDRYFPEVIRGARSLEVSAVNLRDLG